MPSYYASQNFSVPVRAGYENASVHEVAVGDFNGDGKVDVLLTYFLYPLENRGTPVRFFTGDGAGGFTDRTAGIAGGAPATVHAREVVVGDFNRDGRADVFVADHGYDTNPFPGAQNALLLSSGATGLANATAQLPQVSDYTHSAEAADIDRDGDLDIYVGNGGGGTAWVRPFFLINDGAGGFTRSASNLPTSVTAAGGPNHWAEAFIDVDADGDQDLFLGSSTNTGSRLLLNNGQGVFTDSGRNLPRGLPNADAVDIQAFDANGDGRLDLVANYSVPAGAEIHRQIQLLLNDGAGGFTDATATSLPASMNTGIWVRRVHLTDVNGDGLLDMVLSDRSSAPFYLNDGMGNFIQTPSLLPGNEYDQITPAEVNGDGRTDFIAWRGKWDGQEQLRVDLGIDPGTSQQGTAAAEGFMGDNDAETMNAGGGDDWLAGDKGDDTISGGTGADLFHTHGDAGIDRVLDFSRAEGDRVNVLPGTTYTTAQVGGDVVITMGGGGQMVLVGVQLSSLTGDWIFGA